MSQRFVKFERKDAAEMFIRPPGLTDEQWFDMLGSYIRDFETYVRYRDSGVAPQDARYILPGGFVTKMIVKMNTREWRHVLRLRLDKSAQPEMRELMQQVYGQLIVVFPSVFDDVLDSERAVR
jgi:flavin-dependent thymidylate synthase